MENLDTKYKGVAGIYIFKSSVKGKVYIGSTCNLYKRINNHIKNLRKNTHHTNHFQNHFNKYGENVFSIEILEIVNKTEGFRKNLFDLEQVYLDKHLDSCLNSHHKVQYLEENFEAYKLHSQKMKKWWEEDKSTKIKVPLENLKKARLGSDLRWKKIKNKEIAYTNPRKGCTTSLETKSKQSLSAIKRGRHTSSVKKVFQYSSNGDFIKEWESGIDAARELFGNYKISANIYANVNKKRNECRGFIWRDFKCNKIEGLIVDNYKTINISTKEVLYFKTFTEIADFIGIDKSVISRRCGTNKPIKEFLVFKNDR